VRGEPFVVEPVVDLEHAATVSSVADNVAATGLPRGDGEQQRVRQSVPPFRQVTKCHKA
jgi:hypothetical protein